MTGKKMIKKITQRIKEAIGYGVLPNVSASKKIDETTGDVTWDWNRLIATLIGFGLFVAFWKGLIELEDLLVFFERLL